MMPMSDNTLYDTPALFGQHMSEDDQRIFTAFYRELFAGYAMRTVHDCTIGAGGTTLPLAKLGYAVSGSDLNENLLNRAKVNFADAGFSPHLFSADLRNFGDALPGKVDCVLSTGNSLPHVDLNGFGDFLRSASSKLGAGGLLFFDLRNWDAILAERPIMHAIDPKVMTEREHRSVYLLFNWHDDGSVTFSFATSVDRDGKHVSLDILSAQTYYPLLRRDIEAALFEHGFDRIRYMDMDAQWLAPGMEKEKTGDFEKDFDAVQWYGVLAAKR